MSAYWGEWRKTIVNFIFLLIVFCPSLVLAHKITLLAYEEKNTVYCESFYEDGRPVVDAGLKVTNDDGVVLLSGKTDSQGLFQFPRQGFGNLHLTLKSHLGHSSSIIFNGQTVNQTALSDQAYSKPELSKILIGIFTIFGLFGITAYLMSKKNSSD